MQDITVKGNKILRYFCKGYKILVLIKAEWKNYDRSLPFNHNKKSVLDFLFNRLVAVNAPALTKDSSSLSFIK